MKLAVLSDIHSNKYALSATLQFLENKKIDKYIFLGDYFGYYPWANECFELLKKLFSTSIHILGNHDELIIRKQAPEPLPEYWHVILHNRNNLNQEAIYWLEGLNPEMNLVIDSININMFHGTPDNPLLGRYYPDNEHMFNWFPNENEILLLGHTHYPINKETNNNGLIINPGSVGQPRDGILDSSCCIIDTNTLAVLFHRIPYPVNVMTLELEKMNWYPRAINSLKKKLN